MKIMNSLKSKNIIVGYLYFYVHMITEIVCFFYLSRVMPESKLIWLIPFIYDAFAFVPQSIIGYISDKYRNINIGLIGVISLTTAYIIYSLTNLNIFISLFILCIGNAFIHVSGAESTLRVSEGKLSHPAIFVGGGSFGVVLGKVLATTTLKPYYFIPIILTMIPFILLSNTYLKMKITTTKYDYANKSINSYIIMLLAVLIVIIRGYIGYGIPTSWNKTMVQTVLLFFTMGIGKCLGGILSDTYGIKKVGIYSCLLAIPFLMFGDDIMLISLIGVMLFSMTMAITLALLVSVLKKNPGLAFGLTTIGLFLGTLPIFFISIKSKILNIVLITLASILCAYIFKLIIKDGEQND